MASGLRVAYSAGRTRTVDPVAGFLMAANGITLTVGLVSRSPVITMVGRSSSASSSIPAAPQEDRPKALCGNEFPQDRQSRGLSAC
ncbi:hypothetical protein MMAD_01080 [Mycolicibacterium madagascariense]|uniref:Uncharacterized protein n=1 Tax=Mycolicibacterium madagascariense TaxID=212765 RepID=A0A7I7XA76_9MYCO|nr:hypothetical protein MMAD_01080 [Mycolicibacterium madagascariense]